ncbi:glycine betaine/L-proline ABC transporter substrate-binding protein ProX [Solimicrobium silvestre]|nr:glycine betaine/L-proline ABC transporter substrate-binding protein ProX [Solimicrobium silvestre]
MLKKTNKWLVGLALFAVVCLMSVTSMAAEFAAPGNGVKVTPIKSSLAEETFQAELVIRALRDLGYDVNPIQEVDYAVGYIALASGNATFLANNWSPLHNEYFEKAGGTSKLYRQGMFAEGAVQGYLIDKKTADKYHITNLAQLRDPQIAKLFDSSGNGKADLAGCDPGWGCAKVIEHQLDAYDLRNTVTNNSGNYAAIIADTMARYKQGKPILYTTWTPYWLSAVLVPGRDVVWLEVPFSAQPDESKDVDTALPNGKNYGFALNHIQIVANLTWAKANPAAAKLFAVMKLPLSDISAQNAAMAKGQNKPTDINRHVSGWIKAHQATYDEWLKQARAAT